MIENILKKLSEVSSRFEEIESLLRQPGVTEDQENYINLTKEYFLLIVMELILVAVKVS